MTWSVYADTFESGDLASPVKNQIVSFNKNLFVKALRTQVVLVGNPTFTNLKMNVYNSRFIESGTPDVREVSSLRATSTNSFNPSDLLVSFPNGLKEIYFEFNPFSVSGSDVYHIALEADSYTPTVNSYLAWRNIWPDPVYDININVTSVSQQRSPYMLTAVIGSEI
jgi:hypothetical protein